MAAIRFCGLLKKTFHKIDYATSCFCPYSSPERCIITSPSPNNRSVRLLITVIIIIHRSCRAFHGINSWWRRKDKEIILFQVMIGESRRTHCVGDERIKGRLSKKSLLLHQWSSRVSQRYYDDDDDHGARQTVDGTHVWCDATLNVLKLIAWGC